MSVKHLAVGILGLALCVGSPARAGGPARPSPQPQALELGADSRCLYLKTGIVDLRGKQSLLTATAAFDRMTPYVIQLDGPITPEEQRQLEDAGVILGEYLPMHAYLARLGDAKTDALMSLPFITWVGRYEDGWKLSPQIGKSPWNTRERRQLEAAGRRRLSISLFPGADASAAIKKVARRGTVASAAQLPGPSPCVAMEVAAGEVEALTHEPGVMFIEEVPEAEPRNASTNWISQSNVANSVPLWNAGLHGEGQIAGIIDWDLVPTHCSFNDPVNPIGPLHRKIVSYYGMGISPGYAYHGTHVSGTLAGYDLGETNPNLKGMAYGAKFVFQHYNGVLVGGVLYVNDRLTVAHNDGARVHSNSWGSDSIREYNAWSRDIDLFTRNNEDDLVVVATTNGNAPVKVPENAKNCLAVAATQDEPYQDQRCYGGYGPTLDGRQKPEVWAPGCGSYSADYASSCGTHFGGGTSYAAPAVSGMAVLARQYFMQGFYPSGAAAPQDAFTPSGALLKAVMVNSAVDMSGFADYFTPQEGWGRILMDDALYFAGESRKLLLVDVRNSAGLSTGQSKSFFVNVNGAGQRLKITLVWTDVPGALSASYTPVNNLDLLVTAPGSVVYHGNVFSGGESAAGGSADSVNNTEQVHRAAPATGGWRIDVLGTAVNKEQQGFALVVTGDVSWYCSNPECTPDLTPPTPDPMTFASAPAAASTNSITMTATTATEIVSPPAQYYFSFVSGGPGGADSGWQPQTAYVNAGLSANTAYCYQVKARDSHAPPNETGYSAPHNGATGIETPTNITFDVVTDNSIQVTAPGTFTNLTGGLSGLFFEVTRGNGAPIGGAQANAWVQTQTITVTDLTPGITYRFRVKARNWYGQDETPWYPASGYLTQRTTGTAPCTPCGDLDHDEDIDYDDYVLFRTAMGHGVGEPGYDRCADLDNDNVVSIVDYQEWLLCYRSFIGDPFAPPPAVGPMGDVNRDGFVTVADIQPFIAVLLGSDTNPTHEAAADMDGSGPIDGIDIQLFVNAVFGM